MSTPSTDPLREVGRIGRAHGVRGELYVDLLTDREERLAVGSTLLADDGWLTVQQSRRVGARWLVHFAGVADRNAAERLSTQVLRAEPLPDRAPDDTTDDALWVHELIGARVIDLAGVDHGRCVSVLANPAHDILELDTGWLVPVVFVVSVANDGADRHIVTIDPPDGLFD